MSEFLRPRLIGARFDDGDIPLEMLSDLSALREIVIEVAKWRYLQANPNRKRSPKGFADGVSFNLTRVEKGSAIPVINIQFHPPQSPDAPQLPGMPGEFEQYFVEARDTVISAIAAAERNELTEVTLPEKYLSYFDRFGRRLRDGESIEFSTSTPDSPARLTKESRRRLVLASHLNEVAQEVNMRGYISEMDQSRKTFEFQLLEGRKVGGVIHEHQRHALLEVFNSYSDGGRAMISGIGKYDQQERLVSLESIESITILDPLDVPSRLYELRELKDGWLDGEGVAPDDNALDWLSRRFDRLYSDELPLPHIYPTAEGGVQAEWSFSSHEVSLTVDLATREGEWHVLATGTDVEETETLNLADDNGWIQLTKHIRALSKALE